MSILFSDKYRFLNLYLTTIVFMKLAAQLNS